MKIIFALIAVAILISGCDAATQSTWKNIKTQGDFPTYLNMDSHKIYGLMYPFNATDPALKGSTDAMNTSIAAKLPTAGGTMTGPIAMGGYNITGAGNISATAFYGNGAALTGITGATGGVANTGSTTVGADTDANGVGVISLQTRGTDRLVVENNGTLTLQSAINANGKRIYGNPYPANATDIQVKGATDSINASINAINASRLNRTMIYIYENNNNAVGRFENGSIFYASDGSISDDIVIGWALNNTSYVVLSGDTFESTTQSIYMNDGYSIFGQPGTKIIASYTGDIIRGVEGAGNQTVKNIEIVGSGSTRGMSFLWGNNRIIEHVIVSGCVNGFVELGSWGNNRMYIGCTAVDNSGIGFYANANTTIIGGLSQRNDIGCQLETGNHYVYGLDILDCPTGLDVNGESTGDYYRGHITLKIRNATTAGVVMKYAENCTLDLDLRDIGGWAMYITSASQGNEIHIRADDIKQGIAFANNANNNIISGSLNEFKTGDNTMAINYGYGATTATNNTCDGLYIYDAAGNLDYGIYEEGSSDYNRFLGGRLEEDIVLVGAHSYVSDAIGYVKEVVSSTTIPSGAPPAGSSKWVSNPLVVTPKGGWAIASETSNPVNTGFILTNLSSTGFNVTATATLNAECDVNYEVEG